MVARCASGYASVFEGWLGRVCSPTCAQRARLHTGGIVPSLRKPQGLRHTGRHSHRQRRKSAARPQLTGKKVTQCVQDIKLRLATLPPPKGQTSYPLAVSSAPQAPTLVVEQLTAARTLINACLDVVDVSTWAGDAKDPNFISGQMRLLDVNIHEAKAALNGGPDFHSTPWWSSPIDPDVSSNYGFLEIDLRADQG
jgi:hypothetical protein